MQLKPLQQWYCDTCGEVIKRPLHGFLAWRRDEDGRALDFRICHNGNALSTPPQSMDDCKCDPGGAFRSTYPLDLALGSCGMAWFLAFIDRGEIHDPEAKHLLRVNDLRSWTETFRRLFLPHYEEGRFHFDAAKADGLFEGANESTPYTEDFLKRIIERYGSA